MGTDRPRVRVRLSDETRTTIGHPVSIIIGKMRVPFILLSVVQVLPIILADDDVKETDDAYIVELDDKDLKSDKAAKSGTGQTRLLTNNAAVNGAVVGLGVAVLGALLVGKLTEKKECPPYRGRRDAQNPQTRFLPGLFGGKKCPPPPAFPQTGPTYNHPSSGYNNGYRQPSSGYNQPSTGYQQPSNGYNRPSSGYQQPSSGYNTPNNGYNRPNSGYNTPNNGYNRPNSGYNGPSSNYNPQAPVFHPHPTSGYQTPTSNYGYQNPSSGYRPSNNYNPPALSPIYTGRSEPKKVESGSGPKDFGGAVNFGQTSIVHVQ